MAMKDSLAMSAIEKLYWWWSWKLSGLIAWRMRRGK